MTPPSSRTAGLVSLAFAAALALVLLPHRGIPAASGAGDPADDVPAQAPAGPILAVVGGILIDGTGAEPIPDAAIIIEGGRVMAAGPRRQTRIPPGAVAVDATGMTVLPGLVDMHAHLVEGVDPAIFLRYGVTSIRHMGATTLDRIREIKAAIDSGKTPGPRIFHCGRFVVSQPPLDPSRMPPGELGQYSIMRSPEDAARIVHELKEAGADLIKLRAQMTLEALRAVCAAAAEEGLPVSFDSDGGASYGAVEALDAGARGVEHLSGIDFDDAASRETALSKMLEVRAFAVPTFAVLERTYSDARLATRREFIRKLALRGGTVVAGSDAPTQGTPPGLSLHEELQYLVNAGLSPMEALVAATGAAGRMLGYQGLVGTIETGSWADLVIVRGAPYEDIRASISIERVFKGGVQVYPESSPSEP